LCDASLLRVLQAKRATCWSCFGARKIGASLGRQRAKPNCWASGFADPFSGPDCGPQIGTASCRSGIDCRVGSLRSLAAPAAQFSSERTRQAWHAGSGCGVLKPAPQQRSSSGTGVNGSVRLLTKTPPPPATALPPRMQAPAERLLSPGVEVLGTPKKGAPWLSGDGARNTCRCRGIVVLVCFRL
jgi:hypothetical protein